MGTSRSDKARAEVLEAAADIVAEVGLERTTIEEISARSGVAKTTIYRHWPSKQALMVDTVRGCFLPMATPNTGDLRADLITCFDGMVRSGLSGRVGRMLPSSSTGTNSKKRSWSGMSRSISWRGSSAAMKPSDAG